MRTTAIFSYKGGTGKTTSCVNLAAELAARGKRVLVIDADGQRNASDFFQCINTADGGSLYDVLMATEPYPENVIYETPVAGVKCLPSSERLATVELDMLGGKGCPRLTALHDLVQALAEDGETDCVLIDCPPSFAPQSVAALLAADDVIIPVTPDNWSVSGLRDLTVSLDGARRSNPALRIAGILCTRVEQSATARDVEAALRDSGYPVFSAVIHYSYWAGRSTFLRLPLCECASWTGIAADYSRLCDEYLQGGVGNG